MDIYIPNILILFVIVFTVVADSTTSEEEERKMSRSYYVQSFLCPPLGKMNKFELETIHTTTKMYGCAYLEYEKPSNSGLLFHVWVENPQDVVDIADEIRENCDSTQQMDHFIFQCLSDFQPTNKDEYLNGWRYTSLLEYTADDQYENVSPTKSYRCALYNLVDDVHMTIRSIQMVISKPVTGEEFDVSQCEGLSALLGREDLPMLPKGMRYWPDGSMLINLLGRRPNIIETTTNNSKPSPNPITMYLLNEANKDVGTLEGLLDE